MNTKKIITQFKREFWENKGSFIYTPLIITGLYVVIGLLSILFSLHINVNCSGDMCGHSGTAELASAISALMDKPSAFNDIVLQSMYVNCAFLSVAFGFVMATYVLRCLFDDRKNRDILFWRSMPVSEATNVLVKLAMLLIVTPMIVLIINELVTLIFIVFGLVVFSIHGSGFGYMFSSIIHGNAYYIPFQIFYENVFGLLMLMPAIGYFLCASAVAKKSPFFMSALVPTVLLVADVLLDKILGISIGAVNLLLWYAQVLANVKAAYILQMSLEFNSSMILPFIVCVSIGSAFVAGAIWLRNNRYEI